MNESDQMKMIFSNVVKPTLEEELKPLGDKFKEIVQSYAWLFDGNLDKTKTTFLELYLDQLDLNTNEINLDYNTFYNQVSKQIKQELYEKAMKKFISSLSLESLQDNPTNKEIKPKEEQSVNNSEQFPM